VTICGFAVGKWLEMRGEDYGWGFRDRTCPTTMLLKPRLPSCPRRILGFKR